MKVVSEFVFHVIAQEVACSSFHYLGAVNESNTLFYSIIEKRVHARQRQFTTHLFSAFS